MTEAQPKIEAFVAVSPRGHRILSTIRSSADESWSELSASFINSEDLHECGWRVHRLECTVMEVAE